MDIMGWQTLKSIHQRLWICFVGTAHLHRHCIMFKLYMQITQITVNYAVEKCSYPHLCNWKTATLWKHWKATRHYLLYHSTLFYQNTAIRKSYFWLKDVHFYGTFEPFIVCCGNDYVKKCMLSFLPLQLFRAVYQFHAWCKKVKRMCGLLKSVWNNSTLNWEGTYRK